MGKTETKVEEEKEEGVMMGANRAMRRREQREWMNKTPNEQQIHLIRNGITQKDLDEMYNKGYHDGYVKSGDEVVMAIYASIAKVLMDAGNTKDDLYSFLTDVDRYVVSSLSGADDIREVMNEYGLKLHFKNTLDRVEVV